jgi:hypothetical protein
MLQDWIGVARGGGAGIGGPIGLQLAKNRAKVATAPAIVFISRPLNLRDRTNDPTDFDGEAKKMATSGVQLVQSSRNGARCIFYIYKIVSNAEISGLSLLDAAGEQLRLRQ